MRLKKTTEEMPLINVIPMIDIMFFLLVFFMISTMYMTNLKTVHVKLAELSGSKVMQDVSFAVTVNEKGEVFVGDARVDLKTLQKYAEEEMARNPNAMIVLRSDAGSHYESFSAVLDVLKQAGVAQVGIASDTGESQ